MTAVARLTADLTANTAQFEEGMKRANKSLLSFGNVAKVTFEAEIFKNAFEKLGEGLKELTFGAAEYIDATAKQARSLNESVAGFQAQSEVAKEAGVDQEALANAIGKTQKALFSAAEGSKAASATFRLLNLNVGELIKMKPEDQFNRIMEALSRIQNPTERVALAMQLFGKTGRTLLPMLDDYANKLNEAKAFQEKFNIAITQVDARKVEEAKVTFDHVKEAIGGLGNTIAKEFSPLVTLAGKALLDAGVDGTTFSEAVKGAMKIAATAVDAVRQTVLGLGTLVLEIERGIDNLYAAAADKMAGLTRIAEEMPFFGDKFKGSSDYFDQLARGAREDAAQLTQAMGPSLKIMVDEAVAAALGDPRSRTRETMRATHGVAPLLTQR
jgi:hypothetical protein